jgi:hypothetical protein
MKIAYAPLQNVANVREGILFGTGSRPALGPSYPVGTEGSFPGVKAPRA